MSRHEGMGTTSHVVSAMSSSSHQDGDNKKGMEESPTKTWTFAVCPGAASSTQLKLRTALKGSFVSSSRSQSARTNN